MKTQISASKRDNQISQQLRERLAFIEFRLWFLGDVRRPDLIDRFGIAPAVATRDLAAYRDVAPNNVEFDGKRKLYAPTTKFVPVFEHDPDRVLSALSRGFGDGIGRASNGFLPCDFPLRLNRPPLPLLAVITKAIYQHQPLRLTYHSLSRGRTQREIVPFALVDNGIRWHVRAFDRLTGEFRDMVITRMENAVVLPDSEVLGHETVDQDVDWNRNVTLELVPHPDQPHPGVVARDFGMTKRPLRQKVRAAIVGYVLQQWSVDCSADHSLDPMLHRLWLKDPLVLDGVSNAMLAPGYSQ